MNLENWEKELPAIIANFFVHYLDSYIEHACKPFTNIVCFQCVCVRVIFFWISFSSSFLCCTRTLIFLNRAGAMYIWMVRIQMKIADNRDNFFFQKLQFFSGTQNPKMLWGWFKSMHALELLEGDRKKIGIMPFSCQFAKYWFIVFSFELEQKFCRKETETF